MSSKSLPFFLLFVYFLGAADAAVPTTKLYPFGSDDLLQVRAIVKAEGMPDAPELVEAWRLYGAIQGSWQPGAQKPTPETIAQLDKLKGKLEALKVPAWFTNVMQSPNSVQARLADKIGDVNFMAQRETAGYQMLKALAIVYLTEHELDREGAADKAGMFLTVLSITHPWDWQVHALYARLLIDASQSEPGWHTAILSIFLNPEPSVEDLRFLAFIGSVTAISPWTEIQEVIRQASPNSKIAEQAIADSAKLFNGSTKKTFIPPKNSPP